ncbi:MAG: peptidylprolyl isomerase [bacterium]
MKPTTLIAIIVVLAIPLIALLMYKGSSDSTDNYGSTGSSSTSTPTPAVSPGATPSDAVSAHQVILKTDKGAITIDLYPDQTPMTVMNFATLGKRGYYNGIIFHRVIKDFVVQGGDPTGSGTGGTSIYGAKFKDENNTAHQYQKGSVGMANAGPGTNGSQFYIVTNDVTAGGLSALTPDKYTLFGQVADDKSMAVVTALASVPVDGNDKPTTPIKITGFEISKP